MTQQLEPRVEQSSDNTTPDSGAGAPEPLPKTYGATPYAKELMKALGGDPRFMTMRPNLIRRWGLDKPDSVMKLIPDQAFVSIVETLPEGLFAKTETQLASECAPDRVDRRMRVAFWDEYEAAAKETRVMNLDQLAYENGARNWPAFADHLCSTPALLAWFISPPASYKIKVDAAHSRGLERLEEILDLPIVDPTNGRVNVGVGMLLIQAFKLLDIRKNGMPTQKIAQITAHQSVSESAPGELLTMDVDAMNRKLAELEAQLQGTALELPKTSVKPAEIVVEAEVMPSEEAHGPG